MSIKLSTGAIASVLSTGSFKSVFENGVIGVYSGLQPSSADDAETGTLLAWITKDGGSFTPGATTNGLNFGATTSATISKDSGETWLGTFTDDGTMGWFRFYANDRTTGESTSAVRFDGSIGTSRGDMLVVTTKATTGGTIAPSTVEITFNLIS